MISNVGFQSNFLPPKADASFPSRRGPSEVTKEMRRLLLEAIKLHLCHLSLSPRFYPQVRWTKVFYFHEARLFDGTTKHDSAFVLMSRFSQAQISLLRTTQARRRLADLNKDLFLPTGPTVGCGAEAGGAKIQSYGRVAPITSGPFARPFLLSFTQLGRGDPLYPIRMYVPRYCVLLGFMAPTAVRAMRTLLSYLLDESS